MQPYSTENNLVLLRHLESAEIDLTTAAHVSTWIERYEGPDKAEVLDFISSTLVVTLQMLANELMECVSNRFDDSCVVSSIRSPAAVIACPLMNVTHFAAPHEHVSLPTTSITDVLDIEQESKIIDQLRHPANHTVVAAFATSDDVKTLRNRGVRVVVGKIVRLLDSRRLTQSDNGRTMGFTGKERGVLRSYNVNAVPPVMALYMFPVLHVDGDTVVFASGTQGDIETTKHHYRSIFNKS